MKLSQSIANMIVKRTMLIIPNSVNVMDQNGIIIASGDVSRLNQRHTGAIVALRNNQVTEIDEHLAKLWNDEVKEGINLPIYYLGSAVGVIGISGNPNEVRQYAQLVKMTAELIMEHAFKLEQDRWQQRYREEFIRALLDNELDETKLIEQAKFFQLDFNATYHVILLKIQNSTLDKLQKILAYLEHYYPKTFLAVVGLDRIAILVNELEYKNKKDYFGLSSLKLSFKICVGLSVRTLLQISFSYRTACYTLAYEESVQSKKKLIYFDEFKLPALLQDFRNSWQAEILFLPIEKLLPKDEKQVLFKSLQQYFLSNCDLFLASQKLFIHPNTLRYRLEKIEQITTLSFNKIEDKVIYYLAAMLYKNL